MIACYQLFTSLRRKNGVAAARRLLNPLQTGSTITIFLFYDFLS